MAQEMGKYETIMVFNTSKGDDAVTELVEKFTSLIEANATIDNKEEWGKRKLAYPIDFENEGFYYLVNYTSKPDFPAKLDETFRITDGILRTLTVTVE